MRDGIYRRPRGAGTSRLLRRDTACASPDGVLFVLAHQQPRRVVLFDVGPRAREVDHEEAVLPRLLVLVPAFDLLGKGVDGRLRDEHVAVVPPIRLEQQIAHAVLLAHLMLVRSVSVVVRPHRVEKLDATLVTPRHKRASVEFEAVTFLIFCLSLPQLGKYAPVRSKEEVDGIWVGLVSQMFRNQVFHFHRLICDERIKVHPPDPIVFPSVDRFFDHLKLMPHRAFGSMLFEVDEKIVAMLLGIV